MTILGEDNLDIVRQAIGVELTAKQLPDATIALPIYEGAAALWAKSIDPHVLDTLANGTDDQKAHIINAVALKTASLLVPALPVIEQESFGVGQGFRRAKVDTAQLAQSLSSRAADEMDAYLNPDGTTRSSAFLPAFAVAPGYRGR